MFETTIYPRVSETDAVGHINNTTLPVWFEAARNPIFEFFSPEDPFTNWKLVLVNFNVDFVKSIYFGKHVTIKTWVKRIGNTSFELYEEAYQNNNLCVKGKAIYVNFNFQKNESEIISDSLRQQLSTHLFDDNLSFAP
jgi:acyl-CoA thioester hydrolase